MSAIDRVMHQSHEMVMRETWQVSRNRSVHIHVHVSCSRHIHNVIDIFIPPLYSVFTEKVHQDAGKRDDEAAK
jgi:hypothetical protein